MIENFKDFTSWHGDENIWSLPDRSGFGIPGPDD
jgi:hypothetical protein